MRRAALTLIVAACFSMGAAPLRAQVTGAPGQEAAPAAVVSPLPAAPAPAEVRTASAPAAIVATPRVPLARRWWFWAGLGGAAVAVIVGAILLTPRDTYQGNASPGVATVF